MKEGVTLACVPDEQVANSAKVWARNSRMAFTPTKDSADGRLTVQVRSPVFAATHGFTFPAPDRPFVPPQSAEDRRFWGPMYVKVCVSLRMVCMCRTILYTLCMCVFIPVFVPEFTRTIATLSVSD